MKRWKKILLGIFGGLVIGGLCSLHTVTSAETTIANGPSGDSEQELVAKALRTRLNTDGSWNIVDYKTTNYIDDTTPDVSATNVITVGSNTTTTVITDLDNPVVGSIVTLITVGGANWSTIADSGNFNIAGGGGWAPDSADDSISFYIQADNDYIQLYGTQTNN